MTISAAAPPPVDERFENLLISPERVVKMLGKRNISSVSYEQSEQGDARRRLLHVEKVAIENKRLHAKSEATYIDSVNHYVHDIILSELTEHLSQTSDVFSNILNLPSEISDLLDAISVRAASISKIEPFVAAIPWMYDELIQAVNTPTFRRRDSKGQIIVVESLRTALSFLGIENLRLLFPTIILKRAMPQVTDPFPCIKLKFTEYAKGTAVTAQHLAAMGNIRPVDAFTLGTLSNLGRCAVIRLYFKLFDKVQLHLLDECRQDKEHKRHQALLKLAPSANYLIALQDEFADSVSADLLEAMMLDRMPIGKAMRQSANREPCEENTLSKLLNQARTYTQIRMLHQSRLVEMSDIKPLLREQNYPAGALEKLKSVDIFSLPVSLSEESS